MTKPTLRAAIEAAEKATPGPCGHCTLPKHGIILPKTGFMASRFWADTTDPQTGRDAEMFAFFGTHGLAILRALEKSKAALDGAYDAVAIVVQNARTIPDPRMDDATDVSAVPFEDIEGLHGPMSECRKALAAIGELFEEEGGDAS